MDATILHAADVVQSAQPALSKKGVHVRKASTDQDLGVGHSILLGHAQDMAYALQVEGVSLLSCLA